MRGGAVVAQKLEFSESVGIDSDRLQELYLTLGDREADRLVAEAIEDLALNLARVGRASAAGDLKSVCDLAGRLERIGAEIGLPKLAKVAAAVRDCCGRNDEAALGAVLARLARVGDQSLSAVWDPRDQRV